MEFGRRVNSAFGLSPEIGMLLHQRGHLTLEAVEGFLYPRLSMLPKPDSMLGMADAVAAIVAQMQGGGRIFIHGDYDVDGITATALLVTFFRETGLEVDYYIPNRLEERYGLSRQSIENLTNGSSSGGLLITVDCGISAVEEVAYANSLGHRVIITDHHEPQEPLPAALAILNPKQAGCRFPCRHLSGVGVAFFLIAGLRRAMAEAGLLIPDRVNLKQYLDLVALGTVADMVPLTGINRILVKAGLEVLSVKHRFGILALTQSCNLADREIISEDISFRLAPRINAAGRLGFPRKGVELLLAPSLAEARHLAQEMEEMNGRRKELEHKAWQEIEALCRQQADSRSLALYVPQCHLGVLGIVASRVVDRYLKPTIVFADSTVAGGEGMVRGSGRSVPGMNLFEALGQCGKWIEQFGGHPMAVGLTVRREKVADFARAFEHQATIMSENIRKNDNIVIDLHLTNQGLLTPLFFQSVQLLQPFGEGNSEPAFLLKAQHLISPRDRNGHLVFQLQGREDVFSGIGFSLASEIRNLSSPVDLVFRCKRSWYRGVERPQIQAIHITKS